MSGQEKIKQFPADGALWFIKWIDEFKLPHLGTRSVSVSVIIQRLPFSDIKYLNKLSLDDIQKILGKRHADPEPTIYTPLPTVMVGSLPILHIGAVYQDQVHVGELISSRQFIALQGGGQEGTEVTLSERIDGPAGWNPELPYKILNAYEYYGIPYKMPRSRCLVVQREDITYVFPKTTIFKRFYAFHTEVAKAFCGGPWTERLEDVICLNDLRSGLKTEVDSSGQWNVILQTLIQDRFAPLLALFYFDEFGRACAESIYARSLQDRRSNMDAPWYASAQIPFSKSGAILRLELRGFFLRSWKHKDGAKREMESRKFLVSEIGGSGWPTYIPTIGVERFNSGATGIEQTREPGPAPYSRPSELVPSTPDTVVDSEHDANAMTSATHLSNTEHYWFNTPKVIKLKKKSSKRYDEAASLPPLLNGDVVSTGAHDPQADGKAKAEAEVRVRLPEKRFEHILEVFETLAKENFISRYRVVLPHLPGLLIRRGSLDCWSLIDDESREHGLRPKRGWRLAEYSAESVRDCLYRTALVLSLKVNGITLYWIEIECRKTEGGFRSPLLFNVDGEPYDILAGALNIIASVKGINMEPALNGALGPYNVFVDCYKHWYASNDSSKLDIESVKRFLQEQLKFSGRF